MKKGMEKWIVLPDIHLPKQDKRTMAAVEDFMIANGPWQGWLQLGDLLDFNEVSSYVKDSPGAISTKVDKSFEAGRQFLDRHRDIVGKDCRMVLLGGNHEERLEAYMEKHFELGRTLDLAKNLDLKGRRIEWHPYTQEKPFRVGNAFFHHGLYTNEFHTKKMVQRFGVNIYTGHLHDIQSYSLVQMGKDKTLEGKSLGCLCDYSQKYLKGTPTAWQQSCSVFYFFPDGYFNEFTMRIFKHRFVGIDGKIYRA
jgi:hypothetical protein